MIALILLLRAVAPLAHAEDAKPQAPAAWQVGTPIVTYWAGPTLDDRAAKQMAEGGFNLVWCGEAQLDVAQRHGLRAQLTDGLLSPASLDNPDQRTKLDALIERVRRHRLLMWLRSSPGIRRRPMSFPPQYRLQSESLGLG